MISVKAGTWDRTYGATQSHSLCSVSDIPTPPGRWQVEHLLQEVGERTGWLRNRLLQALLWPEPGGRRSSEGHAWSVVGVRLGPVLGACPGFRSPPQPSVELN